MEVPFTTLLAGKIPETVIRGVTDLAFRKPAGWVIVDYKLENDVFVNSRVASLLQRLTVC